MDNSKVWKDCIGSISNLIEEADFEINTDSVEMKAMDPSHIALADFQLSSDAFEEYDVDKARKLGIDLDEMDKVVSRASNSDESIIEFTEEDNRLRLEFKGTSTRRFSLPLLELEEEELPEPDLNFTANAKITAGAIKEGLKDAALIGDNVRFELSQGKFLMRIESDTGSAEMELAEGDEDLEELSVEEPSQAMYNISYLEDMVKAAGSKDIVEIRHGKDLPIEFVFNLADGKGRLRFLLAPRVEAE
ncbi:hypothetical protein AKJ50_01430 [candidate division MSBL1 archaeon SCGC-AAA382A13]|uniref:DNA polymerase sliding clamp n=1 Tax=candidate division MSBL1 archaeon SCGC-AAA382A13 TaxID=1698279 RepID=A0A133VFN8_9EURY|nr:hypothetical protein AKJ50_01430 [candidate division MSBL1 archaeon SCGC-AAA382A13]